MDKKYSKAYVPLNPVHSGRDFSLYNAMCNDLTF